MAYDITLTQAALLGVVEGLTEYLPVSSTGHLIIVSALLGIPASDGAKAFEVVIQAGAVAAVAAIYLPSLRAMLGGLLGRDGGGRALLAQLVTAFLPAAVVGVVANDLIKAKLFSPGPVVAALAVGGALMIAVERVRSRRAGGAAAARQAGLPMEAMTLRAALLIGVAQCLAMWPGTSRSMVTIVAALLLGYSPRAAAEFSFLLALPTLGAATCHDLLGEGGAILEAAGPAGLALGFLTSLVVAWAAVKGFVAYLTRHGLSPFGWYRVALAVLLLGLTLAGIIQWEELMQ